MAKYLPKAERMFQKKLATHLAPIGYVFIPGQGDMELPPDGFLGMDCPNCEPSGPCIEHDDEFELIIRHWKAWAFDFKGVKELFIQYGHYLELIEDPDDISVEADA